MISRPVTLSEAKGLEKPKHKIPRCAQNFNVYAEYAAVNENLRQATVPHCQARNGQDRSLQQARNGQDRSLQKHLHGNDGRFFICRCRML